MAQMLYSYLNLESTKTGEYNPWFDDRLYSYLNLESTKTLFVSLLELC